MVFASIREHASTAGFFLRARTVIKLSCEPRTLLKIQLARSEHFVNFPLAAKLRMRL